MAKGYVLNTPKRKNPSNGTRRGVTMVNPRPRASASRWGHESILPRRYSRRERTRAAWENPSPRRSSRRSSNPVQGRIVESGKSPKARKNSSTKQVSGRVVPNKKAGSYARRANTGRRKSVSKNTVSGRVVKTSRSASASKRASSASPKRNSTRSRPQSRNAAGKKKSVATKKRATKRKPRKVTVKVPAKRTRTGRVVRKAYTYKRAAKPKRKTATRRKTTTRRRNPAPKRNTRTGRMVSNKKKRITANKTVRWRTDVHPGTKKRGILGTPMTMAERKKWTSRGFQRAKQKAERAQRVKATAGKKRAPGVKGAAAKGHWRQGVIHPVTGRLVGGRPMSERDSKLFKTDGTTRKGVGPAAVNAAYGLKPSAAKKAKPTRRKTVAAKPKKRKTTAKKRRRTTGKRYRVRKPSGGTYLRRYPTKRRKTAKKKTARRGKTVTVKVPAKRSRSGKILRKAYSYKRKATTTKKRKPAKRKTAKRKTARRYRVRKPGGGTYMRRYPTKRRKATKKRATKKTTRRPRRYRVRKPGGGTYMRRYPTKRRKATKKRATKKAKRGKARRYRVRKPGGGTYMRRYPRRKAKGRKRTYSRKRSNGRRKGKIVRVKGYTRADGVRVKGYSYRLKKTGSRKGKITRNPYKRSKVRVHPYSYTRRKPRRKRVKVPGGRRNQWYPHHYGGKWISQAKAKKLGLLTKREQRAMMRNGGHAAMVTNPEALAMLPTSEQLMSVGKAAGLGFIGFGAAVAAGRALTNVTSISQHLGNWTSVVGNVAAGLGFWALASLMPENEKLQAMKPFVAAGAGMAAIVNIMLNLVASRTIPSDYAAWVMPGAGAAEAAPAAIVEPANGMLPIAPQAMVTNGNGLVNGNGNGLVNGNGNGLVNGNGMPPELEAEGTAGFGQIDIYEAALDGVGGIEEELELELDRMSGMGGDQGGIFEGGKAGVLSGMDGTGEYLEVPMSEYLEVPMSGMGAMVEEAFAGGGSGGVSEYLEVPMSEYLEVPMSGMGAQVEEAYAGMGAMVEEAYAGTGEYLEVPMSGMGAMVEEAYAGMGQEPSVAAVEQSIRTRPLMPGFKQAVAKMVRERIAAGLPLDDAFYSKLGRAAAGLARKKFAQRVRQVSGRPGHLPMEPWKPPLLRRSAPMYRRPVHDPAPGRVPGVAEPIPTHGPKGGDEGIFTSGEEEGIF